MTDYIETIKKLLPLLSNEELAKLNFEVFVEAQKRAGKETEKELEALVEEALNTKPT